MSWGPDYINTHLSIGEETVNDTLQVREGAIRIVPICIRWGSWLSSHYFNSQIFKPIVSHVLLTEDTGSEKIPWVAGKVLGSLDHWVESQGLFTARLILLTAWLTSWFVVVEQVAHHHWLLIAAWVDVRHLDPCDSTSFPPSYFQIAVLVFLLNLFHISVTKVRMTFRKLTKILLSLLYDLLILLYDLLFLLHDLLFLHFNVLWLLL